MKFCQRGLEPQSLVEYRAAMPNSEWETMKNDAMHGGQAAARDIKVQLTQSQRGLCAYCERPLLSDLSEGGINSKAEKLRVEHIHSKKDKTKMPNPALDWFNLCIVCHGGSQRPLDDLISNPDDFLPPISQNLSCDAFKDIQIEKNKLPLNHLGLILRAEDIPAYPRIFKYKSTGEIEADPDTCSTVTIACNQHGDTQTLAEETITHLNLNCGRLVDARRIAKSRLEKDIGQLRKKYPKAPVAQIFESLSQQYFKNDRTSPWSSFFTLVRHRFGDHAEAHLQSIQYNG